ncbi:MAG TPA: Crp/Fnr family transcriptional regulator [Terracidiphilus sp.]|nr:Crp/Fnr family transcriptional regulator [Terracidiphilus sp.]
MLSPADISCLSPELVPTHFKLNQSLYEPGEMIDTVYFLEDAIASVVVTMENGSTVEVGLIGRDGVVGLPAVIGSGYATNRTFIQLPGSGFTLKAKILRRLEESSAKLRSCLHVAVQGYLAQTAQTAACNRVHELEERLARWLMMCSDRLQSNDIPITHEFLAMMLGTRRSSVTIAAGILHKSGLIAYSRGSVTIKNRDGLAHAACECYQSVQQEYLRLGLL